jgi:hypothetical protein
MNEILPTKPRNVMEMRDIIIQFCKETHIDSTNVRARYQQVPAKCNHYFSHIYSLAQHVSALISHHQMRSTLPKLLKLF